MISHYPFAGMLAVKNMLAHSGFAAITERKFVGLSITEMPRKPTNIVELDFILESLPDLKATKALWPEYPYGTRTKGGLVQPCVICADPVADVIERFMSSPEVTLEGGG